MENKETKELSSIKDMSLLINKPYIAYVFKKTQKIAQAVYLITDFFERAEPLRMSLRTNANMLINNATAFLKNDQKDKQNSSNILLASFLETLAFIETAFMINIVSEKNHTIIREEITRLMEVIDSEKDRPIQISREFVEMGSLEEYKRHAVLYKGQEDVLNNNIKDIMRDVAPRPSSSIKDMVPPSPVKVPKVLKVEQVNNKNERLDKMLSLFKSDAELMIKDIATHFKDVSEKTIQRELLLLVAQGKLKKVGERRWSRYRLIRS